MVTTILFGLYTAGVAIVITLISYFTGMDKSGTSGWINYLAWPFMILFLWLAMQERKRDDFGGTISYGQCVGTGALMGLWAGIATGIFMYVYFTAIILGLIDVMLAKQQSTLQTQQIDPEKINKAMSWGRQMFIPFATGGAVIGDVFLGTVFGLILGIFARTKEEPDAIKGSLNKFGLLRSNSGLSRLRNWRRSAG